MIYFEPAYRDYLWGGERIRESFRRPLAPKRSAESWELSDRPEGISYIANGPLKGKSPSELIEGRFPFLIKLIDAQQNLSVQVHPDEEAAELLKGESKTEMWVVLEGGTVYAGFKRPIDAATFERALDRGTLIDLLRQIHVRPGDVLFIPAGRIHAIGAGCLILEVQQNSNTTYRVYDWDRLGIDGKPRELHRSQALASIHFDDDGDPLIRPQMIAPGREHLASSSSFRVERIHDRFAGATDSFQIFYIMGLGICSFVPAKETVYIENQGPFLRITPF